jgi:hypothetical protein
MRRERESVDKRENVIGHLGILRTWCAVNPKYGMALSVEDCGKAVGWLDDAIALLKAQEPRVMTLEEVKTLDRDYYYFEAMRSPGKELREIVGAYGLTCVTWPSITWARQTMGDSGYGKTWRCWTSRPDEKRRAETPWN